MANIAHSVLTSTELHEPKGAATAGSGQVYIANGAGSGNWGDVGTSSFVGMIADFAAVVPPTGWLELNGAVLNTTTYSALFAVMSVQRTGTRTNASAIVTGISSVTGFAAGYYVFGTGINAGAQILSVDTSSQITLTSPATSSGTSTFYVSPWPMGAGTITLPDVYTAGRYRRSRSNSLVIGTTQADAYPSHNHTGTATVAVTGSTSAAGTHTHTITSTDAGHTHGYLQGTGGAQKPTGTGTSPFDNSNTGANTSTGFAVITSSASIAPDHAHTVSGSGSGAVALNNSGSGSETRPISVILMTCVKY